MKAFGGNSGYIGYSESVRSFNAKTDGRYPKTEFKRVYNLSEKLFNQLLKRDIIENTEWHHTSKFGNKTKFYSISNIMLFTYIVYGRDEAFNLYKKSRCYEKRVVRKKGTGRILSLSAEYAFTNSLNNIGDSFIFFGQRLKIVSLTKRRKYPVVQFNDN